MFFVVRWMHLRLPGSALLFFLIGALLLSAGCTTFDKAWSETGKESFPTTTILGRWEGTWRSDANGHNGKLRCVVTEKPNGTQKARFHAIYKKVIGFGYTVPLKTTYTNGVFYLSGETNLGWWAGGLYRYEGYANETNFFSTYRCKYDYGTFQMARPTPESPR
jgi:hypothetical protein